MSNREAISSSTSNKGDVEMIPVYSTANFAESEIITDIFEEEDIAYIERKMEPGPFFVSVGGHDQIQIAVEETRLAEARALIQQALVDEAIPGDGRFLEVTP